MRAFIFSLDAFVAFTLALIAIYSLIFFSSIPSSYYYLLTQGHFLSRDVLMALSDTTCTASMLYTCVSSNASLLDNIASDKWLPGNTVGRDQLVQNTLGLMIPAQFGYTLDLVDGSTGTVTPIYSTSTAADDPHAKASSKLSISTEVLAFGYSYTYSKPSASIYNYLTCNANGQGSGGLITCSPNGNGNTFPAGEGGADQVPSANVKVLKLTIFI